MNKLRKPQIRILSFLKDHVAKTRKQIAIHASVDYAYLTEYLGCVSPDRRSTTEDKCGFQSLLSLDYVQMERQENTQNGKSRIMVFYTITKEGRKAVLG